MHYNLFFFFWFDLKPIVRTISVKVHMHCDKCEADLKHRLIKHKGNFNTILRDIIYNYIILKSYHILIEFDTQAFSMLKPI